MIACRTRACGTRWASRDPPYPPIAAPIAIAAATGQLTKPLNANVPAATAFAQGGRVPEPYTPAKDAKDLKSVLFNWTRNMGMLKGHDEKASHGILGRIGNVASRFYARTLRMALDAPAIVLLVQHHDAHEVYEYYRAGDLCFVSSLHDGMNLVAKEFVAARDDERGVLLLSQFTGAARELPEALIVNPYDTDQCAEALDLAIARRTASPKRRFSSIEAKTGEAIGTTEKALSLFM